MTDSYENNLASLVEAAKVYANPESWRIPAHGEERDGTIVRCDNLKGWCYRCSQYSFAAHDAGQLLRDALAKLR